MMAEGDFVPAERQANEAAAPSSPGLIFKPSAVVLVSFCSDLSLPSTDTSDEPSFYSKSNRTALYTDLTCEEKQRAARLNQDLESVSEELDRTVEVVSVREVKHKCCSVILTTDKSSLRMRRLSGTFVPSQCLPCLSTPVSNA